VRTCLNCGAEHQGIYWWAQYCSRECRIAREGPGNATRIRGLMTIQGPEKIRASILNRSKRPETARDGKDDLEVESTRKVDQNGYVRVKVDGQWKAEHRVVMERILGRPLRRGESVHHRNGIRHDNSEENLELWIGGVRYGQRAHELTCPKCGAAYRVEGGGL
jgi:uncharacterized protein YbaR (Trm112 family)